MGCFTVEDGHGNHAHDGDLCTISTKSGVVIAEGAYNTYGWVQGDFHEDLDVFSLTMMLEAGIAPEDVLTTDASPYRTLFFEGYNENMPKITEHLRFSGFTGLDSECGGCQSIWYGEDEDEEE